MIQQKNRGKTEEQEQREEMYRKLEEIRLRLSEDLKPLDRFGTNYHYDYAIRVQDIRKIQENVAQAHINIG